MSYENRKEAAVDAHDYPALLSKAVEKKTSQGREGIGRLVSGKNGIALDNSVVEYRDFRMNDSMFKLGCTLQPDPHRWAAAMMNSDISVRNDAVDLYFPTGFRAQYAQHNFSDLIGRHFKKPVKFNITRSLGA